MQQHRVQIGIQNNGHTTAPVHLSVSDRRAHLHIVGKTGTGKSTLLRNLLLQDIEAGRGLALIDPHGDLALSLLDAIPKNRVRDVVYLDAGDTAFPVAWNLLKSDGDNALIASGIVSAFKAIWRDSWGPRLEYILYAAVATLLECENTSLLGVSRILSDRAYRAWAVKQLRDPGLKLFWQNEFERFDERQRAEIVSPVQNKVGQLLLAPHVRNIFGQVKSRVSAKFVMENDRVLIVNLAKGHIGEDKANLLGALIVAQFEQAALARAKLSEETRRDFALYVDEFQNFSTDRFASILSEARKYRLSLTVAHQYLDQLSEPLQAAVFGNVGSLIAFRCGERDARVLSTELGSTYRADALTSLPNYEAIAQLLEQGEQLQALRVRTLPSVPTRRKQARSIIRNSRARFGVPKPVVEAKLARWLQRSIPLPPNRRSQYISDRLPSIRDRLSSTGEK